MLPLEIGPPITTRHEVGQVPELIWMFRGKKNLLP